MYYLTVRSLHGLVSIPDDGVVFQGIFTCLITLCQCGRKWLNLPINGTTQPVDVKEEGPVQPQRDNG